MGKECRGAEGAERLRVGEFLGIVDRDVNRALRVIEETARATSRRLIASQRGVSPHDREEMVADVVVRLWAGDFGILRRSSVDAPMEGVVGAVIHHLAEERRRAHRADGLCLDPDLVETLPARADEASSLPSSDIPPPQLACPTHRIYRGD